MKEFTITLSNTAVWDPDAQARNPIPERFRVEEMNCLRLDARMEKPRDWILDGRTDSPAGIRLASTVSVSGTVYDADAYLLSVCPSDSSDPLAVRAGWLVPEHDSPRWRRQMMKRLVRVVRPDDAYWTLRAREDDDTDRETHS